MRRFFMIILFGVLFSNTLGQDLCGIWGGELNVQGNSFSVYFSIEDKNGGDEKCFFSVPSQGVMKISCSEFEIDGGEVSIDIVSLGARFWGEVVGDSVIRGLFFQSGSKFDLCLRRVDSVAHPRRPQEPKRPFCYDEKEVIFRNIEAGINLSGTLTLPRGRDTFDAVLLVSGSGSQNRDEEILCHKPFLVLSDYLTSRGIAVLRYDDRGFGGSESSENEATTYDLAKDAACGIEFLRGVSGVKRVGIIGHSEGGTIGFMLAGGAIEACRIDFVVSLAGAAVSGEEILKKQNYDILRASKIDSVACERYVEYLGNLFEIMRNNDIDFLKHNADSLQKVSISGIDDLPFYLAVNGVEILKRDNAWMRYFRELDPRVYLRRISTPVLALNGKKDLQVNAEINLETISTLLPKATIKYYEGKNHLFQNCSTGLALQYGVIEETLPYDVMADIVSWINRL